VSGEYDMVVKVSAASQAEMKNILVDKVKSIPGIVDVCRCLPARGGIARALPFNTRKAIIIMHEGIATILSGGIRLAAFHSHSGRPGYFIRRR